MSSIGQRRKYAGSVRSVHFWLAFLSLLGDCNCLHSISNLPLAAGSGHQRRHSSDALRGGGWIPNKGESKKSQAKGGNATRQDTVSGHALDGLKNMVASGVASAIGKAILQPFDSIKTMQQNSKEISLSMPEAAAMILSRGGLFALYAGLGVSGKHTTKRLYFKREVEVPRMYMYSTSVSQHAHARTRRARAHTHTHTNTHKCTHAYMHTYVRIYMHTCIYTHINT
jgi:hypothetical protein